jgi:hypothetical protein
MASIVRCRRANPAGCSAALVAAWLIDAMSGIDGVRLSRAETDSVVLAVATHCLGDIRSELARTLAEPRFLGWQVVE